MAEGKKSFQLYTDLIELVNGSNKHNVEIEPMTNEEAGMLFKWILEYVNDLHPSVPKEIRFAVAQVKKQLDEDLERWKDICRKNTENIKKRWNRNENESIRPNTTVYDSIPNDSNDTDKDKDKDKDKDINNNGIINNSLSSKHDNLYIEIINYLNLKTGKNFKSNSKATNTLIQARLKDGYTVDEFKKLIDNKCDQWLGTEQQQYLRPETLFAASHFESYLNETKVKSRVKNNPYDDPNGGFESLDDRPAPSEPIDTEDLPF